jgi:hypothetical protein
LSSQLAPAGFGVQLTRELFGSHARHGSFGSDAPGATHALSMMQPMFGVLMQWLSNVLQTSPVQSKPSLHTRAGPPAQPPEPSQ